VNEPDSHGFYFVQNNDEYDNNNGSLSPKKAAPSRKLPPLRSKTGPLPQNPNQMDNL